MSLQQFRDDWVPFRDPLMDRFPGLTDEDLVEADGSTVTLARRIAEMDDVEPAEAQQELHEFLSGPMPADAYSGVSHDAAAISESDDYIPEGEDALSDDRRFGDDNVAENPVGRDLSA